MRRRLRSRAVSRDARRWPAGHHHLLGRSRRARAGRRQHAVPARHRDLCAVPGRDAFADPGRTGRALVDTGSRLAVPRTRHRAGRVDAAIPERDRFSDASAQLDDCGTSAARGRVRAGALVVATRHGAAYRHLVRRSRRWWHRPDACRLVVRPCQRTDVSVPAAALVVPAGDLVALSLADVALAAGGQSSASGPRSMPAGPRSSSTSGA